MAGGLCNGTSRHAGASASSAVVLPSLWRLALLAGKEQKDSGLCRQLPGWEGAFRKPFER